MIELTQADCDQRYQEWLDAAKDAPVGGTPAVELLWKRFVEADNAFKSDVFMRACYKPFRQPPPATLKAYMKTGLFASTHAAVAHYNRIQRDGMP